MKPEEKEEARKSILEEKKQAQEKEVNKNCDDEDLFMFFESLKPHLKLITGVNKLM